MSIPIPEQSLPPVTRIGSNPTDPTDSSEQVTLFSNNTINLRTYDTTGNGFGQINVLTSSGNGIHITDSTGAVTVDGAVTATTSVNVVAPGTGSNSVLATFLEPSLGAGNFNGILVGAANTANNSGKLTFINIGTGSTSNSFGLSVDGHGNFIQGNGLGAVNTVNNNILDNGVNGTATFAGPLVLTGIYGATPGPSSQYVKTGSNGVTGTTVSLDVDLFTSELIKQLHARIQALEAKLGLAVQTMIMPPNQKIK